MRRWLLKEIADAEGETLPAEGCFRYEIERGLPVQGELQRNAGERILKTQLGTGANSNKATFTGDDANVHLRTCVEIEGAEGGDQEIIGQTGAEGTGAPTQIDFTEVLTAQGVLIGKLCTVTDADTDSAGLSRSDDCHSQNGGHNNKEFFHCINN